MNKKDQPGKIKHLTLLSRQQHFDALSLIGRSGLLPAPYTQEVIAQLRRNDSALFDFYRMFNHRISELERFVGDSIHQTVISMYEIDHQHFYYLALYSFNLKSKQALKQWISNYFNLNCFQINTTQIKIKLSTQRLLNSKLGQSSWLGDSIKTNSLLVNLHFKELSLKRYHYLINHTPFFSRLQHIIEFTLASTTHFKLHFQINADSDFKSKLSCRMHLGVNSWLGEIKSAAELSTHWSELNPFNV